ncbi:MAG: hypothetical protein LBJ63_03360 [Prevotellaceae bacterium]|jgi:hypothetical protein|nr:hypothetical protein [Prevotellaceae bacterium]
MKNIILITTILLFVTCNFCVAQEKIQVENVNVLSNENVEELLPRNAVYIFPDFMDGKVFFKNGTITSAKLNYNTLSEEMQFTDEKGNILAIANPQDIDYVIIDKKVFYYVSDKKFGELVITNDEVKFLVKRKTTLVDLQAKGAYGQVNTTSAVTSVVPTRQYDIGILRDLIFNIIDEFLLEQNGKFTKISNAKSFIKAFPKYKEEINKYVETNNPNFKNEQDLKKLTNYCIQLSLVK